jgi:hypothetical protein
MTLHAENLLFIDTAVRIPNATYITLLSLQILGTDIQNNGGAISKKFHGLIKNQNTVYF